MKLENVLIEHNYASHVAIKKRIAQVVSVKGREWIPCKREVGFTLADMHG